MITTFKTKVLTTQEEIDKVTSMQSSSPEQNYYLKQAIQDGEIKLEDCYILEHNHQVLARAIIMNGCYLGLYTLENVSEESANEFLANVLKQYPNRKFRTDLYSDKKNYNIVFSSLLANGFKDITHKESYTIQVTPVYKDSKLSFKAIDLNDETLLVDLFIQTSRDNKDSSILKEIKEKGLKDGSRDFFLELKQLDFERELWAIAYFENKPIGFIIITRLTDSDAGIGYIGVVPEYRGNHFSQDLIFKAISLAYQYKIKKLIADIDVENYPMRNNLINCGFTLDCTEISFLME
ncbi:GNAT family N-acetyltransferase [Clostridium sp. UBA1056]|uniref:GNAT family N-acetyltransferase n=1 Tax=unclassified Clostridium TaxID=2614128 RepID=UPI0032168F45